MRHDFSNVSEQQIAALFPILLEPHNPALSAYYEQEADFLRGVFGTRLRRISHIGSSAVPGLLAKPTVDILLEAAPPEFADITEVMLDAGYIVNHPPYDLIMYLKGYTPRGFEGQAVHIHVRPPDDHGVLYFRDYLIDHPDVAAEYAQLKRELMARYLHDRDAYTDAKGAFVERYTALARAAYPCRYAPSAEGQES